MYSKGDFAKRLLQVIEDDILPLTRAEVARGNKIFGAALLDKKSLKTIIAETNNEIENPLWHGEMHALKKFYEIPEQQRPASSELLFLSTHEPCSLCLSAITWCGFDNFYYFFSHQDSRDEFAIPHDLKIMKEVFGQEEYQSENDFWKSCAINELIKLADNRKPLTLQAERIKEQYSTLSARYQQYKSDNKIPFN